MTEPRDVPLPAPSLPLDVAADDVLHARPLLAPPVELPPPPLIGARQLIGTSFDLVLQAGDRMRRASFYVGLVTLGTAAPLALAIWSMFVNGLTLDFIPPSMVASLPWLYILIILATLGVIVASIESVGVAIALLGAAFAGRPLPLREAVQRSRMTFWSLVAVAIIVQIPSVAVQELAGPESEVGAILGLLVGIAVHTPLVYAQTGIVLGGVGAIEALKRSVRIFRARKVAALLLALLPTLYALIVLLAFSAGADVAMRSIDVLGLGADSDPAGQLVVTVVLVAIVFALGTLLFTASAIVYAPQVVMFVGLTRATMGLDRVRPGGDRAVDTPGPDNPTFRWLTRPMLIGIAIGGLGLAAFVASISG